MWHFENIFNWLYFFQNTWQIYSYYRYLDMSKVKCLKKLQISHNALYICNADGATYFMFDLSCLWCCQLPGPMQLIAWCIVYGNHKVLVFIGDYNNFKWLIDNFIPVDVYMQIVKLHNWLGTASKFNRQLTSGFILFRAVAIFLNNDNRLELDRTTSQSLVEFKSRPLVNECVIKICDSLQ